MTDSDAKNLIVQKDDPQLGPVLRTIAKPFDLKQIKSAEFLDILERMKKALVAEKDGVAIAAPQIGESIRVFLLSPKVFENLLPEDLSQIISKETIFINPEIVKISKDQKKLDEGCLSVRPWYGKIKRATRATIKAYNQNGQEFLMSGNGLLAQIFQHEIDHLNGILFIDSAENLKRTDVDLNN